MKILHLDNNHPLLQQQLQNAGHINEEDYTSSKSDIEKKIAHYDGIVIRSRFNIDAQFLDAAHNLKFIARVGAGLESIDLDYAAKKNVQLFSAPEGNRNAVAEHTLGMILSLFNKLNVANSQVKSGQWLREANRGIELDGLTVGLIGYGNMGKAFAKKLRGFNVEVICYDIKDDVDDSNAEQVDLEELFEKTDVLSLHTPWTSLTNKMIDADFISKFKKPFWLVNTARGKSVVTEDLVAALKTGKIKGAGLDVLEYEKLSFENLFATPDQMPSAFQELLNFDNVLLSPHVAGWTVQSKEKLAQTIVNKILGAFDTL
ncbi:2-hydroxyacid dehydrogenase [Aquimarina agarilytica]|uniref:2-hydroxyacid dehydrogenase n=1 Tax=Aquimarina agarilytica TaxID=1087449 RepID=UPI00028A1226|nr:2-hydroxyacid dehydrogenase [Aquimarina agarilytica]